MANFIGSIATITAVAASTTSATLLAANEKRKIAYIYNATAVAALVAFSTAAASATNATVSLAAGETFQVPPGYRGQITGVLASSTGNILVTEVV